MIKCESYLLINSRRRSFFTHHFTFQSNADLLGSVLYVHISLHSIFLLWSHTLDEKSRADWVTFLAHHRRTLECCATLKCEDRSLISPRKIYLDTMRPIQPIQSNVVLHTNRETIYRWMARNPVKVAELVVEKIKKKFIYFLVSFDMCLTSHFSCQTVDTYKLSRVSKREKKMQRQSERICRIAFEIVIAWGVLSWILANNSLKSHKKIRRSSTIRIPGS